MAPSMMKPMAKTRTDVCTYTTVKIDDEVLPLARAAAALSGDITVQEYISTVINGAASGFPKRDPIKRRPAPPKPHGNVRPKKQP